jgi:hypothetical protein
MRCLFLRGRTSAIIDEWVIDRGCPRLEALESVEPVFEPIVLIAIESDEWARVDETTIKTFHSNWRRFVR